MELDNRAYIVTGGSRGFGLAIARSLVERGARVGLLSRDKSVLDRAVSEIGSERALAVVADVSNRRDLVSSFERVKRHFGRLDGLVNNAGVARPNRVEKLDEKDVLLQVNTNFLGTVFACQSAIPLLRGADNPRIVNISSAAVHHYDEVCHLSIYAATKAAVERFSRDLAVELQPDDIGVSCVRPGAADTSFADGWDEEAMMACFLAWMEKGVYRSVGMDARQVGDAVAFCLAQPPGVAVDLLEVRPKRLQKKDGS